MVETLTNVLWLIVALSLFGVWRTRWRKSRAAARGEYRPDLVALICVIALLFPIISMSDDLHPEILAMEDVASGKRNLALAMANLGHIHAKPKITGARPAAILRESASPLFLAGFSLRPVTTAAAATAALSTRSGRSPPLFL